MANPISPLPLKTALTDESGYLSQTWAIWFRALFNRVGGSTAPDNSQILALIQNAQDDADNAEGGLTKGPSL